MGAGTHSGPHFFRLGFSFMGALDFLQLGLTTLLNGPGAIYLVIGLMVGIVFGAIPGLSGLMAIVLMVPFSYDMSVIHALILFSSVYVGTQFGGSISAILLNTPGAPEAICTTFDGYPMTQKGEAGKALGTAITCSAIGGVLSVIVMIVFSPILADVALTFSAAEYFSLILMGLFVVSSVSGRSVLNGLVTMFFGMLLGCVGVSSQAGTPRFDFGVTEISAGFQFISIMLGLFVIGEVLIRLQAAVGSGQAMVGKFKAEWMSLTDLWRLKFTVFRSFLVGTFAGILPGLGAVLAVYLSYGIARQTSSHPEKFGTGVQEGVAAPETANNASAGGAMIPLLTLGIPGSTITLVLLGVFLMHDVRPGPLVFITSPDLIGAIFISMLLANILILGAGWGVARVFTNILKVHYGYVVVVIAFCAFLGSFSLRNFMFDTWVMFAFGILGFAMKKFDYPIGPLVLGLALGPLAEDSFLSAMETFDDNLLVFVTRPVSASFLLFGMIFFAYPLLPKLLGEKGASFFGAQMADSPRPSRSYEIGEAVVFGIALVVLVFLFVEAAAYATHEEGYAFGPDIWPKTAIACLIVFSAVKIIRFSRIWLSGRPAGHSEVTAVTGPPQGAVKALLHIVVFLVYFLGIQYLGFIIGNLLFLPMIMRIAGLKGLKTITVPIVVVFLAIPIFTKFLYVSLPKGVGPFHEISIFVTKMLG